MSLIISALAFGLSALTAWLTLLRKGKLKVTQPTPLLLGYENNKAKISFYAMLYSTAFRGQIIENMHIVLKQNNKNFLFNKWVYAQDSKAYASGCYIKPEGIPQNHQFFTSDVNYVFQPGKIEIEIYVHLPTSKKTNLLRSIKLEIPKDFKTDCENKMKGLMFEWEPDKLKYDLRIDENLQEASLEIFKKLSS